MQRGILGGILERQKYISEKTGEIWIKSVV